MIDHVRLLHDSQQYEQDLGRDYHRLYQLKQNGASKEAIKEQKAKIKSDKARLRNITLREKNG